MTKFYDDIHLATQNKATLERFEKFAKELRYERYNYCEDVDYITKEPLYSAYFGKADRVCICCELKRN